MKITIIGAGQMGSAIAKGLAKSELLKADDITLFDLAEDKLKSLNQEFGFAYSTSLSDSITELNQDGVLIIAVKPQNIDELLNQLSELSKTVTIVSIAAGTKISAFEKTFPENPVIRVMPNTPSQIGKGASVLAPNSKVSQEQITQVENIFKTLGVAVTLSEEKLDAVTALSGSGPAYIFLLTEAMTEAGIKLGLDAGAAETLARQTVYGSASLIIESGETASVLREKVTSPNGTTQAALEKFAELDLKNIVFQALEAASNRSQELSN